MKLRANVCSQSSTRGRGKPEVGDARFPLSKDIGHLRRVQTPHWLLSRAVSGASLCELRANESEVLARADDFGDVNAQSPNPPNKLSGGAQWQLHNST